jgi:Arc/MetJ-type ribon-helix-helix transcriptional regulator
MKEKPILLRLPEVQLIVLDNIVKHSRGRYKSRNDLMREIIDNFIEGLRRRAENELASHER